MHQADELDDDIVIQRIKADTKSEDKKSASNRKSSSKTKTKKT